MKKKSIKVNALMNIVSTASTSLIALLTVPYVSRVLTVDGNGMVTFAQSVSNWLLTVCVVGIPIYGIRECAKVRDNSSLLATVVKELLCIISICTAFTSTIFIIGIFTIPKFHENTTLMCIFFAGMLLNAYGVEWFYRGIEEYTYITIRSIIFKILSLMFIFLFVREPQDYLIYGLCLSVTSVGNNLLNVFRLTKILDFRSSKKLNIYKHIESLKFFFISEMCISAYTTLDMVILGLMTPGAYQTGLYQLVVKCKTVLNAISAAISTAISSRVSYEWSQGMRERCYTHWNKAILIVCTYTMSILGYILIYAETAVSFISSDKYIGAAMPLRIACVTLLFMSMDQILRYSILSPIGKERTLMKANLIGAILCLAFGIALDHFFGAVGASLSVLIAECTVFVILFRVAYPYISKNIEWRELNKIILSNLLAIILSILLYKPVISLENIFLELLVSLSIYYATLLLFLCLTRSKIFNAMRRS